MARRLLNCWIVALWLWVPSLFSSARRYLWSRKSYSFHGRILHAGVAQLAGWRLLSVIEFVPPKGKRWTRENVVVLFRGQFRVWRLRLEEVQRFDTREEAIAFAKWGVK